MALPPNFCCWMSVLVSVRPLKTDSKIVRAESAVASVEIPRISGCSFAAKADAGSFGLMSQARDAAGRPAGLMARIAINARRSMKHLQTKQKSKAKRKDYA